MRVEIGCAHGGFLKLLELAGFETLGIEMDSNVASLAHEWFGVDVMQGPLENVAGRIGQFDLIVMLDVLEHLPDPPSTMRLVLEALRPGGVLVVQTPEFLPNRGAKWHMFNSPEHIYLFTRESFSKLCALARLPSVSFEPAIFGDDFYAFVSATPRPGHSQDEIDVALERTSGGRVARAMLELAEKAQSAETRMRDNTPIGVRRSAAHFVSALSAALRSRLQ